MSKSIISVCVPCDRLVSCPCFVPKVSWYRQTSINDAAIFIIKFYLYKLFFTMKYLQYFVNITVYLIFSTFKGPGVHYTLFFKHLETV